MRIEYLKGTHDSKAGDVKDIPDMQAAVLVLLGIAEPFEKSPQHPIYTPVPENARFNLNGTPVIDDFGNISTVSEVDKPNEAPAKSTAKRKKKE